MPKEKLQETLVFTYKSDLPAAEAPFEIFADCLETGKSNTWGLEAQEWKKCHWSQDGVKNSKEALLSPPTSYQQAGVARHFGVKLPTRDGIRMIQGINSNNCNILSWN